MENSYQSLQRCPMSMYVSSKSNKNTFKHEEVSGDSSSTTNRSFDDAKTIITPADELHHPSGRVGRTLQPSLWLVEAEKTQARGLLTRVSLVCTTMQMLKHRARRIAEVAEADGFAKRGCWCSLRENRLADTFQSCGEKQRD